MHFVNYFWTHNSPVTITASICPLLYLCTLSPTQTAPTGPHTTHSKQPGCGARCGGGRARHQVTRTQAQLPRTPGEQKSRHTDKHTETDKQTEKGALLKGFIDYSGEMAQGSEGIRGLLQG